MNRIRCIIAEDEPAAFRMLKRMIGEIDPDIDILFNADTVKETLAWLKQNTADLIFLDIHLADGSGFDIFRQLEIHTPVIFTTAYDQYAIRAFELNSVDFLLKPIEPEQLQRALKKFRTYFGHPTDTQRILSLLRDVQSGNNYRERLVIQAGSRIIPLETQQIAYAYSLNKETYLCTDKGKTLPLELSLDKLEMQLDPARFFRVNRKILVNYSAISSIVSLSKSRLRLETQPPFEEEVLVSIHRTAEFRKWLMR